MKRADVVIIGGGQAGLAMSHGLQERGIDHVVLEQGRVAQRWRAQSWDSLRLLSPNWHTRLPGWTYHGPDPDGYMTKDELIAYLEGYAASFAAPVVTGARVEAVTQSGTGYRVETSRGGWQAPVVVIATGHCQDPLVPAIAKTLSPAIHQVTPAAYRNPEQLPAGGVLVVGGSSTGVQLAEEIHRSGRPVTLSTGRHTRLPRRYRGKDIMWWLDRLGIFEERIEDVHDPEASRAQPSLQLVGRADGHSIDFNSLQALGVRITGRAAAISGASVRFADDLAASVDAAEHKLERLLERIDASILATGLGAAVAPADRPIRISIKPYPAAIDLEREGIRTVIWATGYVRRYSWLKVPVLDGRGEVAHRGGVTPAAGLYVLGLRWLRRRNSNFIDGVGADAEALADHAARYLDLERRKAA